MEMGLVPKNGTWPPHGAISGGVLVLAMPMQPASTARSV